MRRFGLGWVLGLGLLIGGCGSSSSSSEGSAGAAPSPKCGDGLVDVGETCDDGPLNGAYGKCRADCSAVSACGDGVKDAPSESCDDGAHNGTYGKCRKDCSAVAACGDGTLDAPPEGCDDGPLNGTYGKCRKDCSAAAACGDGTLDAPQEGCDDGSLNGTYGKCRKDCSSVASCGDGVVDAPDEVCDEGGSNGQYGHCTASCKTSGFPYPPGKVDPGWVDQPPACDDHDWFAKYLTLRRRFRGNGTAEYPGFISLGTAAGQGIPASRREPDLDCAGHWSMESCPRPDLADAKGRYAWGDATIWLGMYLEVLATEYALFQAAGLDTAQPQQDLFYALNAFDRVDEAAEVPFGKPPARDGFFLRDDVPEDFHLLPGGYRFPRSDASLKGFECVISTSSCGAPSVADGSFTSQDQVIGLIHGLALVSALVPDTAVVDGMQLRQHGREIVHRMVTHLRSNLWRVTAPDGTHPPDAWGGNAIGFSYLLAGAANKICGNDFGMSDYQDVISSSLVGKATLQALDTGWDATFNYNRTMGLRLLAITDDWDDDKYTARAVSDGKDAFVLARALIHGTDPGASFSPWRVEAILDSAPCSGPCFHSTGCADPPGWAAEHRTSNPGDRFGTRHWSGEFNGIDYMALHNLYALWRSDSLSMAIPDAPASCASFRTLDQVLASPSQGETWDPADPCARGDLKRRFCGRTFADWLDAAWTAKATVQTANLRWSCQGSGPCQLQPISGSGTDGDDLLLGGPGADDLSGGGGNDCIYGMGGNDKLVGGAGDDELHGGEGDDTIEGDGLLLSGTDRLFGEQGNDVLLGGPGADELLGGDDNDTITAGDGHDLIHAGGGDDTVQSGAGDDTGQGGPGNDAFEGGGGDDTFWCGEGRDKAMGGDGNDWLYGDQGDDLLIGDNGNDMLSSGDGVDHMCGGDADDTIWGNWAGALCSGGAGTNTVNGCSETLTTAQCSQTAWDSW
jgi:hypothetical protein